MFSYLVSSYYQIFNTLMPKSTIVQILLENDFISKVTIIAKLTWPYLTNYSLDVLTLRCIHCLFFQVVEEAIMVNRFLRGLGPYSQNDLTQILATQTFYGSSFKSVKINVLLHKALETWAIKCCLAKILLRRLCEYCPWPLGPLIKSLSL